MMPYAGFTYFGVALDPSVPAVAQGLFGTRGRRTVLVVAVVGMTIVQYGRPSAWRSVASIRPSASSGS